MNSHKTLIENKQIRAKLGGDNFHAEQSLSIPENYKNGLKYHRECYQKFTYAKTLYKRKITDEEPCGSGSRKRKDLKLEINKKQHLFPDYCYFCKKNRITVNKKEELLTKIVTYEAQETLLKIATEKNDFDLLGAIKDVDLIASEILASKSCYKSYTRSAKNNSEPSYEKGNFEAVCNVIEDEVIFKSKSFSIDALLNLYRENIDDLKQYRYYLKK